MNKWLLFIVLILIYAYVVVWSDVWRWKFWITGRLDDFLAVVVFSLAYGWFARKLWELVN